MAFYIFEIRNTVLVDTIHSDTYTNEMVYEYMAHNYGTNWKDYYMVIKGEKI